MGKIAKKILVHLNKNKISSNPYFDLFFVDNGKPFEYSIKSGDVVYNQFPLFNNFENKTILDYGCGHGGKTISYALKGATKVYGIDVWEQYSDAINYSETNNLAVSFLLATNNKIPLEDNSVDVVISSSVLEHIENPIIAFREIYRVLKTGGKFLVRWQPYYTRYGAHLNDLLPTPFIQFFFKEKDMIDAYKEVFFIKYASAIKNRELFLNYTGLCVDKHVSTFKEFGVPINKYSVIKMKKTLQSLQWKLLSRQYYQNKSHKKWLNVIPEHFIDPFIDYEIAIWEK